MISLALLPLGYLLAGPLAKQLGAVDVLLGGLILARSRSRSACSRARRGCSNAPRPTTPLPLEQARFAHPT